MEERQSRVAFLFGMLQNPVGFTQILIVVVFLGLGIFLVGSSLDSILALDPARKLLTGSVLLFASFAFLSFRLLGQRARRLALDGFFIYENRSNSLLPVPRYDYGYRLARDLKVAFAENEELRDDWDRGSLSKIWKVMEEQWGVDSLASTAIIREATEYFVLDELSVHLGQHFRGDESEDRRLREYPRQSIPEVLLKNRLIDLFSQYIETRNRPVLDPEADGRILLNRFDLVLPPKSTVRRIEDGALVIDTPKFTLRFKVVFQGFTAELPHRFLEYYMNRDEIGLSEFMVSLRIRANFKFGALLSSAGWDYYWWMDSFLRELEHDFAADEFFKNVGWEHVVTLIEARAPRDGLTAVPSPR